MLETSENLNNQAIELASQGDYAEAIACFQRAISIEKENYLLWFNLGLTYRDAGNINGARAALEKAYGINPVDEEVLETLAIICYSMSDFDEAFKYTAEGLNLNEENYRLWNTLGVLYFNQSDYGSASEAFEQALTINPYYYDSLFNLRDAYGEMGNTIGMIECSKRMAALPSR